MTDARLKLALVRSERLFNYYAAERRAGTPPLLANERMHEFAKRIDASDEQKASEAREYEADLSVIRECMGRVS